MADTTNSIGQRLRSTSCSERRNPAKETGAFPENITRSLYKIVKKLMNDDVFNCKLCGTIFTTAAYSVHGTGIVCETCLNKDNEKKGQRLDFFDTFLNSLPVVPCSNAERGCKKVFLMSEDLETHVEDCQYRLVNCLSPSCFWDGKQDDLAKHFEEKHRTDVISEATAFTLNLAGETPMMMAKLLIKNSNKYFVTIRLAPKLIYYNAFRAEEGHVHEVAVSHCCSTTGMTVIKRFKTESLNKVDRIRNLNKIILTRLKDISEEGNELSLSVEAKEIETEEKKRKRTPISNRNETDEESEQDHCTEALSSDSYMSCAYEPSGCKLRLLRDKIDQHQSECVYGNRCCLLPDCSYRGDQYQTGGEDFLQQHVTAQHKHVLVGGKHEIEFVLNLKNKKHSYITYVYFDGDFIELRSCFTETKAMVIHGNLSRFYTMNCTARSLRNHRNYVIGYVLREISVHSKVQGTRRARSEETFLLSDDNAAEFECKCYLKNERGTTSFYLGVNIARCQSCKMVL